MEDNIQFVTAEKVNVTQKINNGKTAKFTCRFEADNHARQKGSYVYNLFCFVSKSGKDSSIKSYGFAVPN